eukprot:176313-Lingulodinium_polyedra.AAC.1
MASGSESTDTGDVVALVGKWAQPGMVVACRSRFRWPRSGWSCWCSRRPAWSWSRSRGGRGRVALAMVGVPAL